MSDMTTIRLIVELIVVVVIIRWLRQPIGKPCLGFDVPDGIRWLHALTDECFIRLGYLKSPDIDGTQRFALILLGDAFFVATR